MKKRILHKIFIRQKLIVITLFTSSIALLLASAVFLIYDQINFRQLLKQKLNTLAEIIGNHSTAALIFDNEDDATETLGILLKAEKNILFAAIYDKDDKVFARYKTGNVDVQSLPPMPEENNCTFGADNVILYKNIYLDNEEIGKVYIQSSLNEMKSRLQRYVVIVTVVLAMAILSSYIMASRLQRIVSEPILHLARVAHQVSVEKNYTVRANKTSEDELGYLTEQFNDMLKQIQASLEEKEVLMQEIHHRVKNNMQVMSSLLYLQSKKAKDRETLEMFRESQNRILSMAMIHEQLYQSSDILKIDFTDYIKSLTSHLIQFYNINSGTIRVKTNVGDMMMNIDNAIPCGLIINELVSNSLKHAFPNGRNGEICVEMNITGNRKTVLTVSDDGIGLPENLDIQHIDSLGLRMVANLTNQLRGSIEIDRSDGTKFTIEFRT